MTDNNIDIQKLREPMFAIHASKINLTYEWRKEQLETLLRMVNENGDKIQQALIDDLGRDPVDATLTEVKAVEGEIEFALKSLKQWMTPTPVPSPLLYGLFSKSIIERRPMTAPGVLIIGPCNYPISLCIRPLIGAFAGGNPAVIKPSEITPKSSALLKQLFDQYYGVNNNNNNNNNKAVQVVLGGVPLTSALLDQSWGKVFFTGSTRVGKIIAEKCAKTLTPLLLELGGKNPVIVDETVPSKDLQNVADRIIWAKLLNAGQTCIAPDTIFVHISHSDKFIQAMVHAIQEQYGQTPSQIQKGDLTKMVTTESAKRVMEWIQEVENQPGTSIAFGGSKECNVEQKFICPTLVFNPPETSHIMTEEVFSPIIPVTTFEKRDEVIQRIQKLGSTNNNACNNNVPLSAYYFVPSEALFQEYSQKICSASSMQNDCVIHYLNRNFPFGGLGSSGYGSYHGQFSFEAFSHAFCTVQRPLGSFWDFGNFRCHPYSKKKGDILIQGAANTPYMPVITKKTSTAVVIVSSLVALGAISMHYHTFENTNIIPNTGAKDVLIGVLEASLKYLRDN